MTNDREALVDRVLDAIRKVQPGGCRVWSKGDECECLLCAFESLLASAPSAPPPSEPVPTPKFLRSRAQWYRDGCDGLEDVDAYKQDGLAEDAANDLTSALDLVSKARDVIKARAAACPKCGGTGQYEARSGKGGCACPECIDLVIALLDDVAAPSAPQPEGQIISAILADYSDELDKAACDRCEQCNPAIMCSFHSVLSMLQGHTCPTALLGAKRTPRPASQEEPTQAHSTGLIERVPTIIRVLRMVADRESPPSDATTGELDAAFEDVPEVTWAELGEMSKLMREAADALEALSSSAPVERPIEIIQVDKQKYIDMAYALSEQVRQLRKALRMAKPRHYAAECLICEEGNAAECPTLALIAKIDGLLSAPAETQEERADETCERCEDIYKLAKVLRAEDIVAHAADGELSVQRELRLFAAIASLQVELAAVRGQPGIVQAACSAAAKNLVRAEAAEARVRELEAQPSPETPATPWHDPKFPTLKAGEQ